MLQLNFYSIRSKVSILIPLYNSEQYIKETIISALNQTWQNKEIIVIDDGSGDRSLEIAKKFESSTTKIISKSNSGASSSRNYAFGISSGDYIQYLDSDDLMAPDKIEKQVFQLEREPEGAIASGPFFSFKGEIRDVMPILKDNGLKDYERPIDWLVEASLDRAMFPPLVWLTPRKTIEEAGKWNESLSYNDDSEFFTRVLLRSSKIVYCDEAISYYRRGNPNSLGSQKSYAALKSGINSLNLVTQHMLEFENSERVRKACAYQYSKNYYSLYPEHRTLRNEFESKMYELDKDIKFDFGSGLTSRAGKLFGWKTAKWLRYYLLKAKNTITN